MPVGGGFGKPVEEARVGGGEGGDRGEGVEAFEREGRAGTVAQEALDAGTVVRLDAHGVQADGRYMVGATDYGGRIAPRPTISNWRTRPAYVEAFVEVVRQLSAGLPISTR